MNSSRQKRRMAGKAILKLDRIVNFSAANRQLFSSGNSASRLPRGYNARVIAFTMNALFASAVLSAVAIFCFAWSMPAARVVLPFTVIAAGFGVFGASRIAATPQSGFAAWAFPVRVCMLRLRPQRHPEPISPADPLDSSVYDIFRLWGHLCRHGGGGALLAGSSGIEPYGRYSPHRCLPGRLSLHISRQNLYRSPRHQDHAGLPSLPQNG